MNILLVEDDTPILKQIRFILERDHTVEEAQTANEALQIVKNKPIDIAIVDLGLPPFVNTPDEGLRVIDYVLNNTNTKIIVLTGQDMEGVAKETIKRGVFDFLAKPVSMEKFLHSLDRAILFKKAENQIEKEGIKQFPINVQIGDGLQSIREEAERKYIWMVLKENDFNIYKSAKIMGIKRESLYYFIKKFGWKRESEKEEDKEDGNVEDSG